MAFRSLGGPVECDSLIFHSEAGSFLLVRMRIENPRTAVGIVQPNRQITNIPLAKDRTLCYNACSGWGATIASKGYTMTNFPMFLLLIMYGSGIYALVKLIIVFHTEGFWPKDYDYEDGDADIIDVTDMIEEDTRPHLYDWAIEEQILNSENVYDISQYRTGTGR